MRRTIRGSISPTMPTPSRRRSARRRPIRNRCRRRKRASRRAPRPTISSASMRRCPGSSKAEVLREFGGGQFSSFKNALVELCVAKLSPIASEMKRLVADPGHVDAILVDGADRARAIADETMKRGQGHRRVHPQALMLHVAARSDSASARRRLSEHGCAVAACVGLAQHRDMHDHPATKLRDAVTSRNAWSSLTTPRNGTARSITPAAGRSASAAAW